MKYLFYVDIGVLSGVKAEEYVRDIAVVHSKFFDTHDKVMWIPTKHPNYTHVEVLFDFFKQEEKSFPEISGSTITGE